MGSLRNPIGPLPSSIYWRRRAVALAVLALLALLTLWALRLSGAGDGSHDEGKGGGSGPASSITPGPTDSGPAISERPGGRDDAAAGGGSGGGSEGGAGGDAGGGAGGGTGEAGGSGSGSGWKPGGSGGSASSAAGGSAAVPAGSQLDDCGGSGVTISLRSVHKEYGPGEKPRFELTAENKRGTACKLDLGPTATVVTIKDPAGDKFWASDDCSRDARPALFQLPANGKAVHTFTWHRKPSAANCGTPTKGSAKPGHYKIEVAIKGIKKADVSFDLK